MMCIRVAGLLCVGEVRAELGAVGYNVSTEVAMNCNGRSRPAANN